jgi:hypothetical protein
MPNLITGRAEAAIDRKFGVTAPKDGIPYLGSGSGFFGRAQRPGERRGAVERGDGVACQARRFAVAGDFIDGFEAEPDRQQQIVEVVRDGTRAAYICMLDFKLNFSVAHATIITRPER